MKKTVVIGASINPERYSNRAIINLVAKHHDVIAIGQKEGEVAGVKIHVETLPRENVHTVTLYLRPYVQKEYYDYILQLKPKRVVFNPGTENPELYQLLTNNGIEYEVACTLVLLATNQY